MPVQVLQAPDTKTWVVRHIIATHVGSTSAEISIFHDPTGTTYDETTAIDCWKKPLGPGESLSTKENQISLASLTGNLAVQTSVASAVNFYFYGWEVDN